MVKQNKYIIEMKMENHHSIYWHTIGIYLEMATVHAGMQSKKHKQHYNREKNDWSMNKYYWKWMGNNYNMDRYSSSESNRKNTENWNRRDKTGNQLYRSERIYTEKNIHPSRLWVHFFGQRKKCANIVSEILQHLNLGLAVLHTIDTRPWCNRYHTHTHHFCFSRVCAIIALFLLY